jgi:hypothetical protein
MLSSWTPRRNPAGSTRRNGRPGSRWPARWSGCRPRSTRNCAATPESATLTHGDFGLGTFNHLDGETVILDGTCYYLRADGTATIASGEDKTTFAAVLRFRPCGSFGQDGLTRPA